MAKKNSIQNFKIDSDAKKQFNELCEANFTTASHELRMFVYNRIKELKSRR